jgi:hypothetical protein
MGYEAYLTIKRTMRAGIIVGTLGLLACAGIIGATLWNY